jgi:hypothetical protein
VNSALQTFLPKGFMEIKSDDIRALVYVMSATVCGYLGTSESLARCTQTRVQQLWVQLCPLYLLAACNALMHLDSEWILWARAFAREQHAYELRRPLQSAVLVVLMLMFAAGWQSLRPDRSHFRLRTLLLVGAFGTLVLHLLRYVSFHYTDIALNHIWHSHSVASWIEFTSLGLVGAGTGLELLRSQGHV